MNNFIIKYTYKLVDSCIKMLGRRDTLGTTLNTLGWIEVQPTALPNQVGGE